jgi:hypothetical protein
LSRIRIRGYIPPRPQYVFMAWYLIKQKDVFMVRRLFKHKDFTFTHTRLCPKVSGLAIWSENFKWYSPSPLGAVLSLFYEPV